MNTLDEILTKIRKKSNTSSEFMELESLEDTLINLTKEMKKAEEQYDLNLAASLKYGVIQDIQERIDKLKELIKFKIALALKETLEQF